MEFGTDCTQVNILFFVVQDSITVRANDNEVVPISTRSLSTRSVFYANVIYRDLTLQ